MTPRTPQTPETLDDLWHRLYGIAGTMARIKADGSPVDPHPFVWHDLDDVLEAIRGRLEARALPDPTEPGATKFEPWFEVECQQMCGGVHGEATEATARAHAEATGHETALIRHESTHYRRPS